MGLEPSEEGEEAEIVTRLREVAEPFDPPPGVPGTWVLFLHPRDLGAYRRSDHAMAVHSPGDPLEQTVGQYKLVPDDWIPQGEPRILPERYRDLPPGQRHLDIIPHRYADQLVPDDHTPLCQEEEVLGDRVARRCGLALPFEVISVDTELDHETLQREGLDVNIDEQTEVSSPAMDRIHSVPIQIRMGHPPPGEASAVESERVRRNKRIRRTLIAGIREVIGGSVSYRITRRVTRPVESDTTDCPVDPSDLDAESAESRTFETEVETVTIGERTLELGAIVLDPQRLPDIVGE